MTAIGLVLQGGGALGAYEFGVVTHLVEMGLDPVAVTGVSIGAINAAAIAGARDGDIAGTLRQLWTAITLNHHPLVPDKYQELLSAFGVPSFYKLRHDWFNAPNWAALCDTSPMQGTLAKIVDFDRLNQPDKIRFSVTATDVNTGLSVRFCNQDTRITPDHILASGSLPPGFPMTKIGDAYYWDGGLFDNTPLRPLVEMLTPEETETLPIIVIDLFPTKDAIPKNLVEIKNRMMEISFENKFWDDFGGPDGLVEYAKMLGDLDRALPAESDVRKSLQFRRMMQYRSLKNLKVVNSEHVPMTGGMDFSEHGIQRRFEAGYRAAGPVIAEIKSQALAAKAAPVKSPAVQSMAATPAETTPAETKPPTSKRRRPNAPE